MADFCSAAPAARLLLGALLGRLLRSGACCSGDLSAACSAWRCLRVRVRTVGACTGGLLDRAARARPARRLLDRGLLDRGLLGRGLLDGGLAGSARTRLGRLDGVDQLRLLHRAGAGDAEAGGHGLEVGQQHRAEAGRLGRRLLGRLLPLSGAEAEGVSVTWVLRTLRRLRAGRAACEADGGARARGPRASRWAGTGRCAERRAVRLAGWRRRTRSPGRDTPSRPGQRSRSAEVSAVPKASTVGPAPDTTAGTPSARRRRTSASVSRHGGLALVLVQPVAGGGEQVLGLAGECGDEQRGATRVGGGVGVRHRVAAAGPRATVVSTPVGGTKTTAVTRGSTPTRTAYQWSSSRPEIDEAAVEGRGDVVGVALEVGGEVEERLVGGEQLAAGDQPAREHDAGDDRRRRGAEAARVRDDVAARQAQPGRLGAHQVEGRAHRAHDEVRLVARHAVGAGALDLDDAARRAAPRPRAGRAATGPARASRSRDRGWRTWRAR